MLFKSIILVFMVALAARADLVMEQRFSDTNVAHYVTLKLRGDKMRMDQQDANGNAVSVIVDLNTRDSLTLLATNKTFLKRFGSEIRWEMAEARKYSGGTNDMDKPPAPAVATGKSETVNGQNAEIYAWSGAQGVTATLWVARRFPNYDSIRMELAKLDRFNDSGPHRNAQPELSRLPGMVVKSETTARGRTVTTSLVSVKLEPVDASLFELPAGYSPWKPPANKNP